ncbi:NAD-dependent epimerase/dehydratase family protein [Devosia rhodophyticola]|uniref:NAD-dependent epimerase/dehydratase family protein n=1 Tax=Devosia rhodophyticola TaxID=3026423 RepID=A0ABY7YU52_9HYPH|nr:NAD-dependent epimerase/dehydratase family protein [Devosia rhodophyticola]WDR04633.1 NAD-dependent epimerase/dehydratase family protein [Devosia rhodophyticola]
MDKHKITILGINGHIGHAAAEAFAAAGWQVTGFGRSNRKPIKGVGFIKGDAGQKGDIEAATAGAEVVFNGLNLPYDKWDNGRAEAQLATVLAALKNSGKTLLFPGNIYNFAASDRVLTPELAQHPETARGAIRVRQEQMLERATEAGDIQVIILRAGDFYGPNNQGDWFDQAMMMNIGKGRLHHMADLSLGHAWAYLPDLGAAFVKLAERRQNLKSFDRFHFAGHYVTHGAMMAAIKTSSSRPLRVVPMPWILLRLMGLGMPMIREVVKMRYLWDNPMRLEDQRLVDILGSDFGTEFGAAVGASVVQYFAEPAKAA